MGNLCTRKLDIPDADDFGKWLIRGTISGSKKARVRGKEKGEAKYRVRGKGKGV